MAAARDTLTVMQQELFYLHNMLADFLQRTIDDAPPVIVSKEPVRHPSKPTPETDLYEELLAPAHMPQEALQVQVANYAQMIVDKVKTLDALAQQLPDVATTATAVGDADARIAKLMAEHLELKQKVKQEQGQLESTIQLVHGAHAKIATTLLQAQGAMLSQ